MSFFAALTPGQAGLFGSIGGTITGGLSANAGGYNSSTAALIGNAFYGGIGGALGAEIGGTFGLVFGMGLGFLIAGPAGAVAVGPAGEIAFGLAGAWLGANIGGNYGSLIASNLAETMAALGLGPRSAFGLNEGAPFSYRDPFVIDLGNNGLQLTSPTDSKARFDYDGKGYSYKTGWIGADDGLLVKINPDKQNIQITRDELLGASTGDALTELTAMDTNNDGLVDRKDASFDNLAIWNDKNQDGITDINEIISLDDLGIASFSLKATNIDSQINTNRIVLQIDVLKKDNSTITASEINFSINPLDRRFVAKEGYKFDNEAAILPNIVGYGYVPDLIHSMSEDVFLKAMVKRLVMQADRLSVEQIKDDFTDIIYKWAGVYDTVSSNYGIYVKAPHLQVVEAFYGMKWNEIHKSGILPNEATGRAIEKAYESIFDTLYIRFISQISLTQLMNGVDASRVFTSALLPFSAVLYEQNSDILGFNMSAFSQIVDYQLSVIDEYEHINYLNNVFENTKSVLADIGNNDPKSLSNAFLNDVQFKKI